MNPLKYVGEEHAQPFHGGREAGRSGIDQRHYAEAPAGQVTDGAAEEAAGAGQMRTSLPQCPDVFHQEADPAAPEAVPFRAPVPRRHPQRDENGSVVSIVYSGYWLAGAAGPDRESEKAPKFAELLLLLRKLLKNPANELALVNSRQ